MVLIHRKFWISKPTYFHVHLQSVKQEKIIVHPRILQKMKGHK